MWAGLLSSESRIRGADVMSIAESHIAGSVIASGQRTRAVEEPEHAPNLHVRDPGEPTVARRRDGRAGRSGKAKAVIPRCTSVGSRTGL